MSEPSVPEPPASSGVVAAVIGLFAGLLIPVGAVILAAVASSLLVSSGASQRFWVPASGLLASLALAGWGIRLLRRDPLSRSRAAGLVIGASLSVLLNGSCLYLLGST